ncbi:hypothetical protein [Chlamydia pecorum]|uniref:Uncharacterized protein n=1 Tax=Chlamydia pecorum (strain ATCC VR-628 / DSM 29919 / E58) TaxID=331635 RepID=A0AA34WHV5_CHLPE|nr:hypothetical protein [Chlamydia pecorum]AEB41322.1 hypothetical protein G5S_0315 [Chlamydia pecorum E58]ETF38674.1 hypothetical protein CpecS_0282 [Chlamydia pecorum VR629]UFP06886.1 hypothetical protein KY091_00720 [Chlamydia pecorum]UJT76697.1 ChPn 76Kda [Chlamydia pecorum]
MVNPLGTNEHEQIPIEPLASKDASSASSTEAASKTQEKKTEGPTPQAVETWSFLSAARNALSSLVNRLLGVASSTPTTSPDTSPSVDSTDPTNPTDPVDPTPPPPTFDDYKTQAETAYNTFLTSTDYSAVQAAAVSLQEAVNKMNELAAEDTATEEQKTTAAEWGEKNTKVTQVYADLEEISRLLEENKQYQSSASSLANIDLVNAALLKSEENAAAVEAKLDEMNAEESPPLGRVPASAEALKTQMDTVTEETKAITKVLIDAYNAGEDAYGSVQQAMANNSQANIDAANAQITQAKETIQNALQTYPNSPVLQTALSRVTAAEAALQNIKPAEAPSSGGAASAGSAQHRSFSVGNVRVALLLDDAESESTATVLSGLRKMIELFQSGTTVGGEAQKAETEAEAVAANDSATTEEEAQAAVEEALQTMAEAKTREGLIDAMGQIASAAMVSAGVPQAAAAPVAKSVKQLYSASSSTSSKRFADGYSAYQSLTDTLSSINDRGRNALDAATQSALSQPVPRRTETRARGSEDLSQRVARSIAEDSKTYGDIYARVGALESLSTVLQNNPNANDAEIKQALMSEVNKPPKFGYPYVQLPSESMQKYLGKLMQEFVDGTKAAAERKMLSFDTRTQFIQQVLVNLGSLYAAYLS